MYDNFFESMCISKNFQSWNNGKRSSICFDLNIYTERCLLPWFFFEYICHLQLKKWGPQSASPISLSRVTLFNWNRNIPLVCMLSIKYQGIYEWFVSILISKFLWSTNYPRAFVWNEVGRKGSSRKSHGVICGVIWYLYHLRPGWLHFESNLVKDEKPSSSAISYRAKYHPFFIH